MMDNMLGARILFVGGTFDNSEGCSSSVCKQMINILDEYCNYNRFRFVYYNGGKFSTIEHILSTVCDFDIVFWFPNIPNTEIKFRNIKEINPNVILITSKRNDNNKYSNASIINHALNLKSNLVFEFSLVNYIYKIRILDPLGNLFYDGFKIKDAMCNALKRILFLSEMTRIHTFKIGESDIIPDKPEFFNLIKEYAEVFHKLINPDTNVTRFLGNSSFRCQRGFPSFRDNDDIYVSRRNIDKRYIDKEGFVKVKFDELSNTINYWGDNKPSVDTPIQLMLYKKYTNINYMIHSHCYIKNVKFTSDIIPCGAIEEVKEINKVIENWSYDDFYAINLLGHGCIIMSDNIEKMKNINFISRPIPEEYIYE